jgi:hypothetical protein
MDGLKWRTMTRENHNWQVQNARPVLKGQKEPLPLCSFRDRQYLQPRYVLMRPCDQFRSPNSAVRISLGKGWTTEELWFDSRDGQGLPSTASSPVLGLIQPPFSPPASYGNHIRLANGKLPIAHSRIYAMKSASFKNAIQYGLQCVYYTTKTSMVIFKWAIPVVLYTIIKIGEVRKAQLMVYYFIYKVQLHFMNKIIWHKLCLTHFTYLYTRWSSSALKKFTFPVFLIMRRLASCDNANPKNAIHF